MKKIASSLLAFAALSLCAPSVAGGAKTPAAGSYPYGSPAFTRLVADSFRLNHAGSPQAFYAWMDKTFQPVALAGKWPSDKLQPGWTALLEQRRRMLAQAKTPLQKTQEEMQIAAWLHRSIKTAIPHFSLDEGFEFSNTVSKGERQCFLQATLLAGLLQGLGADAGVVMVYKNLSGQTTNNGHAVTLLKRPDGQDILVDCSEPTPFARHQGIMAADAQSGLYRYLTPTFGANGAVIPSYKPDGGTDTVAPRAVQPLDYAFVRSQFDYYRGERTPGGLLLGPPTAPGLAAEAQHLRTSIAECPQNPLAEYMLGRVYLRQAKLGAARQQLTKAYGLYARFGWVPQGCREAMTEAKISQAKI